MDEQHKIILQKRIAKAENLVKTAKAVFAVGDYDSTVNRTYYAIFHAMRAVLVLDDVDFSKHSGVISYFRQHYVKTGLFPLECSQIIGDAKDYRESSDYEDFVIIEREIAEEQIGNAERFLEITKTYLAGF